MMFHVQVKQIIRLDFTYFNTLEQIDIDTGTVVLSLSAHHRALL